MKPSSFAIGARSILIPLCMAVALAIGIAVLVPTNHDGKAGTLGIAAILVGAGIVATSAIWTLNLERAKRTTLACKPEEASYGEARESEPNSPASSGRQLSPRYAAAAIATVTVVTMAQGGSYETEAPNPAGSLHPGKAASETLSTVGGETAAS